MRFWPRPSYYRRPLAGRVVKTWKAARRAAKECRLTAIGVLWDQLLVYQKYGINPYSYYRYRLYEPSRSMEEKGRYLPDSGTQNRRLWSLLNPPQYRAFYDNKLIFHRFFAAQGLPLARLLAVYDSRPERGSLGGLATAEQLQSRLTDIGASGFVVKPVEGIQGHRILVFKGMVSGENGKFETLAGERYDAHRIIDYMGDTAELLAQNPGADPHAFLIEERILPHPELADFIGPTLCTIRMQTLIARDGQPRIVAAVFKLQPGTSGVDHLKYGAVGAWVNLDTGALERGRTRTHDDFTTTIPGTNRSFLGFRLPAWDHTCRIALQAAAAFPWARCIGWDIGVSERGPMLIEGNERWSTSLIQMPAPEGLLTGELKAVVDQLSRGQRK
jgi:hypothetical protein